MEEIAESHSDSSVQEMASDLRIAIVTHGLLQSQHIREAADFGKKSKDLTAKAQDKLIEGSLGDAGYPSKNKADSKVNKTVKIEVLPSTNTADSAPSETSQKEGEDVDDFGLECSFEKAVEELYDPLIPVRGHGLITLRRLIVKRDKTTLNNSEMVLKVFRENLSHSDSYIYLSSIQGLASLGEVFPDRVLEVLLEEYTTADKTQQGQKVKRSPELQMKMGEVLVKTTRSLGKPFEFLKTQFLAHHKT